MAESKISATMLGFDAFVAQTKAKVRLTSNMMADLTEEPLKRLKSRLTAFDEKTSVPARQIFPNIEPYVEPSNSTSEELSSSSQPSILKLNVGGKRIDIPRSTLTQIKGSNLAFIFSGKWDEILPHDKDGRIFMDFDAAWLEPILDNLRELEIAGPTAHRRYLVADDQPF